MANTLSHLCDCINHYDWYNFCGIKTLNFLELETTAMEKAIKQFFDSYQSCALNLSDKKLTYLTMPRGVTMKRLLDRANQAGLKIIHQIPPKRLEEMKVEHTYHVLIPNDILARCSQETCRPPYDWLGDLSKNQLEMPTLLEYTALLIMHYLKNNLLLLSSVKDNHTNVICEYTKNEDSIFYTIGGFDPRKNEIQIFHVFSFYLRNENTGISGLKRFY